MPFFRSLCVLLLVAVALAGCQTLLNFTPQRAIINELLSRNFGMSGDIDSDSLRVLQTQEIGDTVFVMVRFEMQEGGSRQECTFVYETVHSRVGWRPGGGGGGCGPLGGVGQPIGVGAGSSSGQGIDYSRVDGLVYQADIQAIEVVWEDGENQNVEVINDSYLAIRLGLHEYEEIHALNADGEVVFTFIRPQPAPEKLEE